MTKKQTRNSTRVPGVGINLEGKEETAGYYFDTLTIDNFNFSENMKMFINPIGSYDKGGRTKTECDTNIVMYGMLPAPTELRVWQIRLETVLDTPDTQRYIRNGLMGLWVGQKRYFQVPLSHLNTTRCVRVIDIPWNYNFSVHISCPKFDIENVVKFRIYLEGLETRGIK